MTANGSESSLSNMDIDEHPRRYKRLLSDENRSKLQHSVKGLRSNPFKFATICCGLLGFLLLLVIIGQSVSSRNAEKDHISSFNAAIRERDDLLDNLKTAQREKKELQVIQNRLEDRVNVLNRQKDQIQANNNILTKERDELQLKQNQLQTSNIAITKERDQFKASQSLLQSSNDALTRAKVLLQTGYDSVVQQKKTLQDSYGSVSKQRDNLQNQVNNLTRAREQLQKDYNSLMKDVEDLQRSYNASMQAKDQLESSHSDLSKDRNLLQDSYNVLEKAANELKASYAALVDEKHQLEIRFRNLTVDRDLLSVQVQNLTAGQDKLQKELQREKAVVEGKTCPTGWVKFGCSCYLRSTHNETWVKGREICKSKGADLVTVNTPEESTFLNALYGPYKSPWLGLTDYGVEGKWQWVDGSSLSSVTYWAEGQPNSYKGVDQDCVELWTLPTGTGIWNDEDCELSQEWICEM